MEKSPYKTIYPYIGLMLSSIFSIVLFTFSGIENAIIKSSISGLFTGSIFVLFLNKAKKSIRKNKTL